MHPLQTTSSHTLTFAREKGEGVVHVLAAHQQACGLLIARQLLGGDSHNTAAGVPACRVGVQYSCFGAYDRETPTRNQYGYHTSTNVRTHACTLTHLLAKLGGLDTRGVGEDLLDF